MTIHVLLIAELKCSGIIFPSGWSNCHNLRMLKIKHFPVFTLHHMLKGMPRFLSFRLWFSLYNCTKFFCNSVFQFWVFNYKYLKHMQKFTEYNRHPQFNRYPDLTDNNLKKYLLQLFSFSNRMKCYNYSQICLQPSSLFLYILVPQR